MANARIERNFFNKEIKEAYLTSRVSIKEGSLWNCERTFLKTIPYEEELQKDLSSFTVSEIQDMFKRMDFTSIYAVANFRSQLFKYTQWCIANNMVDSYINNYESLYLGDYTQYISNIKVKRKIITRQELLLALDKIENASDAYALLAIFEGLDGENHKEIIDLRTTDIDVEKKTVYLESSNRTIKVSQKLIELAFEASNAEKYVAASGRQIALQVDPTLVFKSFNNSKENTNDYYRGRRLYFRLRKSLGSVGLEDWSIHSVADSGKIHIINEIAESNNITGEEVVMNADLLKKVEDQFNQDIGLKRVSFFKAYKEYLI